MVERIISGGQTGVDRAALDFAIEHGIPHGGWVPAGRVAEDGVVPERYSMREHLSSAYPPRTEANVDEADFTAIFVNGIVNAEPGCLLTVRLCLQKKKPYQVIPLNQCAEMDQIRKHFSHALRTSIAERKVRILNVAGTRGSMKPDVDLVKKMLKEALLSPMTIDEMPSGPGMDALVAEHVMGCATVTVIDDQVEGRKGYGCYCKVGNHAEPLSGSMRWLKPYSTSLPYAWEVIERLRSMGFDLHHQAAATRIQEGWHNIEFRSQIDEFKATAKTFPHAVGRAALKALRVEI